VALNAGKRSQTATDETGKPLGHLRFDFQYSAEFAVKKSTPNVLTLREANFPEMEEKSKIYFTFENRASISITDKTVPDATLYKLHATDRPLDFDSRIRNLSVRFVPAEEKSAQSTETTSPHEDHAQPEREHDGHDDAFISLYRRLRETDAGIWLILLAFAGLGGAHALTPGHGKTLVAAYLVGQNGTVWHAVLLGLVTTITHTAAVLIIALVLFFVPMNEEDRRAIQSGLGVVLGISVACLGLWLLLQRLSGRADHIHIGGGHDHHHHGPVTAPAAKSDRLGLGGIIILGMNGGLIPCWDAVAILAMVAGSSEFWFALPALLAFSAGLASVLVALGILVVQVRDFAGSKWGQGRIVRALPLLSAVVVMCMGIYLSYASLPRSGR
jgi:nickel/cobalt exporter